MKKQLLLSLFLSSLSGLVQSCDVPGLSVFNTEEPAAADEGFNPEQITSHINNLSSEEYSRVAADIISTDQTTIENIKDTIQHLCNQQFQDLLDRITTDQYGQLFLVGSTLITAGTYFYITHPNMFSLLYLGVFSVKMKQILSLPKRYVQRKMDQITTTRDLQNNLLFKNFNHNGTFNQGPLLYTEEDRFNRIAVMD